MHNDSFSQFFIFSIWTKLQKSVNFKLKKKLRKFTSFMSLHFQNSLSKYNFMFYPVPISVLILLLFS